MNQRIRVNIVVEDALSASVSQRLLDASGKGYEISSILGERGSGYIDSRIRKFHIASKGIPFFILRDLDAHACPPGLINELLPFPTHPNLIFRIVVHEIETWLLADRTGFAEYFRIPASIIPHHVESIENPKEFLIGTLRRNKKARYRDDIVPQPESTAKKGRNYNDRLSEFALKTWDIRTAADNSPSLAKALHALNTFTPKMEHRP